jgi:hypothetical protein
MISNAVSMLVLAGLITFVLRWYFTSIQSSDFNNVKQSQSKAKPKSTKSKKTTTSFSSDSVDTVDAFADFFDTSGSNTTHQSGEFEDVFGDSGSDFGSFD